MNTDIINKHHAWHYLNHTHVLEKITELDNALKILNLTPIMMAIIMCKPKSTVRVHIDSGPRTRILWPIKNCNGSVTKFFDVPPENIVRNKGPEGDNYLEITSLENSKLIEEFSLTAPVVFTPKIPHGVWADTLCNEPRLSLTIQLKESIDYMLNKP
jgi:hypothetical protein